MAKCRHVFVCKDGKTLPEWLMLPGHISCMDTLIFSSVALSNVDVVWIRLPSMEGASRMDVDLVRKSSMIAPTVVMSDVPSDEEALAAFDAGARGYCNSHSNRKILKLISGVVQDGGLWIGESLMQRLVLGVSKTIDSREVERRSSDALALLTSREREVAEIVAGGASNKDVARLLQISERTVKAHVSTLFNKLNVRDRLQLTIKIKMLK